jgi:hypothetical protein
MVANEDEEAPSSKSRPIINNNSHSNKWGFCVLGMAIFCVVALLVTWGSIVTKLYIDERLQSCPKLVTEAPTSPPFIDPTTSRFLVKVTTDPSTSSMSESELASLLEETAAAKQLRIARGIQEDSGYMAVDQWIDWVVLRSQSELTLLDIFATMPLNDYQTYEVVRLLEVPRN